MRLVYLSAVPWESFAQRPHKFVEWFHGRTGEPVLWVDPYPTRFPHWRDLRRSRLSASASQHTRPPTWLTLLKPGGLPVEPLPGSGWANGLLWRGYLNAIGDFVEGGMDLPPNDVHFFGLKKGYVQIITSGLSSVLACGQRGAP
jgi:hypothetical protein